MFDYNNAFSRNIGWVTEHEQQLLKQKRVAMAGAGGVGSEHIVTLARLGITKFNISDFDEYEVHNFNRQAGAFMSTINRPKSEVMAEVIKDINPEAQINNFPVGINETNVDAFLDNVDIYVDSLDFFALSARKLVYQKCYEKQIPLVTAAPIGMGVALLCFMPGSMNYEEYFRFNDCASENEQLVKFLIGVSPSLMQKTYLVDPSSSDFIAQKAPSLPMGVKLCGGLAGSYVLKILLNRGDVLTAPWGLHFDGYRNKMKKTWRPFGNNNPIQKLAFNIVKNVVLAPRPEKQEPKNLSPIEFLYDQYAKMAPSGDNMQPHRIEPIDEHTCILHGFDTSDHVVYDLQGNASKLAIGCLLANFEIAAQSHGYDIAITPTTNKEGKDPADDGYATYPTYKITISKNDQLAQQHELLPYIQTRCVQRKRMGTRPLSVLEKQKLTDILPTGYSVIWLESFSERWRLAKFMYANATTRLSMKEGYDVHSKIMEFTPLSKDNSPQKNCNSTFSKDKLPANSLGLDPLNIALTQWAMTSWERFKLLNQLGGTIIPKLLLDFSTAIKSCAHFVIVADNQAQSTEDYVNAGKAVQRFWLQATALKLGFQPEQTPVIFSEYLRNGVDFTTNQAAVKNVIKVDAEFKSIIGEDNVQRSVFMGRLGRSTTPTSRSVRLSLDELRFSKK
ncbi:MAG: ThiF family adenylyltransferase [Thalassotalea sp.]